MVLKASMSIATRQEVEHMKKLLLSPRDVGEALGIGQTKVYELLRDGSLGSIKIGRLRRIPWDELDRFVQDQRYLEVNFIPELDGRSPGSLDLEVKPVVEKARP